MQRVSLERYSNNAGQNQQSTCCDQTKGEQHHRHISIEGPSAARVVTKRADQLVRASSRPATAGRLRNKHHRPRADAASNFGEAVKVRAVPRCL